MHAHELLAHTPHVPWPGGLSAGPPRPAKHPLRPVRVIRKATRGRRDGLRNGPRVVVVGGRLLGVGLHSGRDVVAVHKAPELDAHDAEVGRGRKRLVGVGVRVAAGPVLEAVNGKSAGVRRETGHTHKHTTRTTQHTTRQEQHHNNKRHDKNNTTHDHTNNPPPHLMIERAGVNMIQVGLYKIFVHFQAGVHESVILYPPPPPALPTRLQYNCTTLARYTPCPFTPLVYAIHYIILVMAISCKGQNTRGGRAKEKGTVEGGGYIYILDGRRGWRLL